MEKKYRVQSEFGWSEWMPYDQFEQLRDFGALIAVETSEMLTGTEAAKRYPKEFARFNTP